MRVGSQSHILKASDALKASLIEAGKKEHFSATSILFREDGENAGVFLVLKGKVCLSVKNMPRLDRLFGSGSVLGLPSSFTGRPYSLTATAVSEADVVQVAQEDFVRLMRERPELCREATEMLGREVTFIQSALAERRRQASSTRTPGGGVAVM
jgi:CRP-like cAMP-binding protein